MELRREFFLSFGALVVFNLLLAFGAIGLLWRMSPAIEGILRENAYSIDAAEEMLAILARVGVSPASEEERARFADALERAEANVTEPEEPPTLERLRARSDGALSGEQDARQVALEQVQELIRINRIAMEAEDERAQLLGAAGAWAAAFIALVCFGVTFLILVRLERRVLEPILELHAVLASLRQGDLHRRCRPRRSPAELGYVLDEVNSLLERVSRRRPGTERADAATASAERSALIHLLEERSTPSLVLDARGAIVATNGSALAILSSERGRELRADLKRVPVDSEVRSGDGAHKLQATELRDGSWLCTVRETR